VSLASSVQWISSGEPEVELRWRELLSGEAAMAIALNASLSKRQPPIKPESEQAPDRTSQRAPKKQSR
jgi:hypothetical protein